MENTVTVKQPKLLFMLIIVMLGAILAFMLWPDLKGDQNDRFLIELQTKIEMQTRLLEQAQAANSARIKESIMFQDSVIKLISKSQIKIETSIKNENYEKVKLSNANNDSNLYYFNAYIEQYMGTVNTEAGLNK